MTSDQLGLVGTTIGDKYRLDSVVGEGGFAVVYRAEHLLWKRPIAVKVFKALSEVPPAQREKLLEEFIREGALLAELSERSSAIVQARDVGMMPLGGAMVPYMVLEWLDGKPLDAVLDEERASGAAPRTIPQAIALIEPAAEALALAHARGIAHRDVKPANIFVLGSPRSSGATVKLLDFGIAKVVQDVQREAGAFARTAGHITAFTPLYGAPEQFNRSYGATGPWTDVFALALVLVELITHREALAGDDLTQLAVSSTNRSERPTPRARGAAIDDALEKVFAKALAVDVADRYPNAGAFWNALREALEMTPMRNVTPSGRELDEGAAIGTAQTSLALGAMAKSDPRLGSMATSGASRPSMSGQVPSAIRTGEPQADTLATPSSPMSGRVKGSGPMGAPPGGGGLRWVAIGLAVIGAGVGAFFLMKPKATDERGAAPPGAVPPPPSTASAQTRPTPPAAACPEGMIAIEGGAFYMGSDDREAPPQEKPARKVRLSPYCIDRFEVTTADYVACTAKGECKRADTNEWHDITDADRKTFDPLCNAGNPGEKGKHPMNCVSWEMARVYCEDWRKARLPTEAEWEFAARGQGEKRYPWGDEAPSLGRLNACGKECVAWGKAFKISGKGMYEEDDGYPATAPVGSFPSGASRYGLEDVAGNVFEWVADWYGPYASDSSVEGILDPQGPPSGEARVVRGGGLNSVDPIWVRPTFRHGGDPTRRSYGYGFRCAKSR